MADKPVSAIDYLARPAKYPPRPVCAAFGDEDFLRRQAILTLRAAVLGGDEGELSLRTFDGRDTALSDVLKELSTVAMFGGQRLAVIEDADAFVTEYRAELEDYVAKPNRSGVLVLELNSLASNTRLYKALAVSGLLIDCKTPSARLAKWLADWTQQHHQAQLSQAAAETLIELVGPELGLLDQELAKLALLAGENGMITPEMVSRSVGGWRVKTVWIMLDAALDGKVQEAMTELDRLLASGEQPIGLLAQVSASLRRFAAATRLILQDEAARRRSNLRDALQGAGIKPFVLHDAERRLRALGRQRGQKLYGWLLQADLDLKGESAMPPRLILERLIVQLAAPQEAAGKRS